MYFFIYVLFIYYALLFLNFRFISWISVPNFLIDNSDIVVRLWAILSHDFVFLLNFEVDPIPGEIQTEY